MHVFKDTSVIQLNYISVDVEDEQQINMQWRVSDPGRIAMPLQIFRRAYGSDSWLLAGEVSAGVNVFTDKELQTDEWEYKIAGINRCQQPLESTVHHSIRLLGQADKEKQQVSLQLKVPTMPEYGHIIIRWA